MKFELGDKVRIIATEDIGVIENIIPKGSFEEVRDVLKDAGYTEEIKKWNGTEDVFWVRMDSGEYEYFRESAIQNAK